MIGSHSCCHLHQSRITRACFAIYQSQHKPYTLALLQGLRKFSANPMRQTFHAGMSPCSCTPLSPAVGSWWTHSRLSCKRQRHWFCKSQQTLTIRHYRFPFSTSLLAGCRACGLLRLHILVLSHMLPCELHACPSCRTISRLFPYGRTHFCFLLKYQKYALFDADFSERQGMRMTMRIFWIRPSHRRPAGLAIAPLLKAHPAFAARCSL